MSLRFSQLGARQTESDIARLMTAAIQNPDLLSLAAGFTDNETLPLEGVTELVVELGKQRDRSVLQYGTNQGNAKLRAAMTCRLGDQDGRPNAYEAGRSLISNGSQQALYLAVQTLCDVGDIVFVEQPTYFVFLEMLRGLGVEAVPLPMLDDGDVDCAGLSATLESYRNSGELSKVKAVYLVSYFANPSGHSISIACKRSLVKLLSGFGGEIAILEDAAYRELYYESPFPAESFLALSDAGECVPIFYTTTLTKSFATGLKVGYGYCNHDDWLKRMLALKGQQDFGTAHFNQELLSLALEIGLFDRQLNLLRKAYCEKMQVLSDALESNGLREFGWSWHAPEGGLYLWLRAPDPLETGFESELHRRAVEAGVLYVPGELCQADAGMKNDVRLSYGVLNKADLAVAAARFSTAASAIHEASI